MSDTTSIPKPVDKSRVNALRSSIMLARGALRLTDLQGFPDSVREMMNNIICQCAVALKACDVVESDLANHNQECSNQ
jgi:hypothetical protein